MQRYFAKNLEANNFFVLYDEDHHHIKNVMRLRVGEKIEVVFNEKLFIAIIEKEKPLTIVKEKEIFSEKEKNNLIIFMPFLREQKIDLVLQKATELGVGQIYFYSAERSIVKYQTNKIAQKLIRWRKICKEASEQAKRVTIPEIKIVSKEEMINFEGHKLVAHPDADLTIKNQLKKIEACDTIGILFGPEGGFSDKELSFFQNNGFKKINLGSSILRTETAPLFILSVIRYEQMR